MKKLEECKEYYKDLYCNCLQSVLKNDRGQIAVIEKDNIIKVY